MARPDQSDEAFSEQALLALAQLQSGLPRDCLLLLAKSGQMRSAHELHKRLAPRRGESLSQTTDALSWLEDWGLAWQTRRESEDVLDTVWGLTNAGSALIGNLDKALAE